MTTVYVITCGSWWPGARLTLEAAQAEALAIEERLALRGEWTYRWEQSDRPGIWLLMHRHAERPAAWGRTGREVRAVEVDGPVEDQTPRCTECRKQPPHPGMTCCSTRCYRAAEAQDGGA